MRKILPALALVSTLGCANNRVIPDASYGGYQRYEQEGKSRNRDQATRRYEAMLDFPVNNSCETVRQRLRIYLNGGKVVTANRCQTDMVVQFSDQSQLRYTLSPRDPLSCGGPMELSTIMLSTLDEALTITCHGVPDGNWTEFLR